MFPDFILLLEFLSDQNQAFQIMVSLAYTPIPAHKNFLFLVPALTPYSTNQLLYLAF
jgi:hypothetical protein